MKWNKRAIGALTTLLFALALPAQAKEWTFFRAADLKRGGIVLTTEAGTTHTIGVAVCDARSAFHCLRVSGGFTLAVPKALVLKEWAFEGTRYKLLEKDAGLRLLGTQTEGIYVEATDARGGHGEFIFSRTHGFFAFQWVTGPNGKPTLFISTDSCAPGAEPACRER